MAMWVIRTLVAKRRRHRYADTRFWRTLNAYITALFDTVDLIVVLAGVPFRSHSGSAERALHSFRCIVLRHMADVEVHDKRAFSDGFRKTLLRFASIGALRRLYPLAQNMFTLRYLDFVYLTIAQIRRHVTGDQPIIDIVWKEPKLLDEICALPGSCIVLGLHKGFTHCTRALSYSGRNLAAVVNRPDKVLAAYKANKVNNPEDIEVIAVNRETLLALTKVARDNKVIICLPDVFDHKTGRCERLSLAMFQFAARVKVPLYFFDFCMDDVGTFWGFIKGPIDCGDGADVAAQDFVGFCQSVSGRKLTIIERRDSGFSD